MKTNRSLITAISAAAGMLAMILDSQTALNGASDGIDLCIKTVIPALFPFFVLSSMLTSSLQGISIPLLRPIGKLLGLPQGSESILLTGLLGGYPVGAQCISQSFADGRLSKTDAHRMLGFCSNTGPAFIFGMSGVLFPNKSTPFILWFVHILSALLTGIILPRTTPNQFQTIPRQSGKHVQPLQTALRNICIVCGWVILFRIVIQFSERWFLWLLPRELRIVLTGILELTNGYLELSHLGNIRLRFIFASIFLSLGGLCVTLQTASIAGQAGLGLGSYIPGKLLQGFISALIAIIISSEEFHLPWLAIALMFMFIFCNLLKNKKNSSSILKSSGV